MTDVAVHVLRQLDVAESIKLGRLGEALRGPEATRGAAVLRGPEKVSGAGIVWRNEPLDLRVGSRAVAARPRRVHGDFERLSPGCQKLAPFWNM